MTQIWRKVERNFLSRINGQVYQKMVNTPIAEHVDAEVAEQVWVQIQRQIGIRLRMGLNDGS